MASYLPKPSHTLAGGPALFVILAVTSFHLFYTSHNLYLDFDSATSRKAEVVALQSALKRTTYCYAAILLASGILNSFVAFYCKSFAKKTTMAFNAVYFLVALELNGDLKDLKVEDERYFETYAILMLAGCNLLGLIFLGEGGAVKTTADRGCVCGPDCGCPAGDCTCPKRQITADHGCVCGPDCACPPGECTCPKRKATADHGCVCGPDCACPPGNCACPKRTAAKTEKGCPCSGSPECSCGPECKCGAPKIVAAKAKACPCSGGDVCTCGPECKCGAPKSKAAVATKGCACSGEDLCGCGDACKCGAEKKKNV